MISSHLYSQAWEQNVHPGTCVDKGVMHPEYTEFLLVAHKTSQSTARPIRRLGQYSPASVPRGARERHPHTHLRSRSLALAYPDASAS